MIVSIGLVALYLIFHLNMALGFPLMRPSTQAADPKVNVHTITDNMDTLLLLRDEEWPTLSARERLDVLQTIANIEATYLGLPHELNVVLLDLGIAAQGSYTDDTHTISIHPDYLLSMPAKEAVMTVAHEAFHAYEHRLVDLYESTDAQARELLIFDRIEAYRDNFENYIDSDEDPQGYHNQAVEQDSEDYALKAWLDYKYAIIEHLDNLDPSQE